MGSEKLHAVLSPSKAHRWLACPPSARLEEKLNERFGDKSSPFAAEGTKAHAVAELKLRKEIGVINDFSYNAQRTSLEPISKQIDWATDVYVDTVMQRFYAANKESGDAIIRIEDRLDMSPWVPHCFGTGDAVIVSDGYLDVLDYKNGSGVPVNATGNPQARLYGLGAINLYGSIYGFQRVRNTIVQPNLDSVTTEELSKDELLAWGDSIKPTAELAWRGGGDYNPGEHCQFCAARALCYHRAIKCMQIFDSGMPSPGILPDSEIPRILEVADIAESWIKDIREYARTQALKGTHWPGFKLVSGRRPPRKWDNPEAVVDQMSRAGLTDEQIYEPKKLISVSEAEKLLGKPAFRALLEPMCSQGSGAPTLVPESDKRPSLNSPDSAFADLAESE